MRLWYLQGINNGDTTVLYWTIDIWPRRSTFIGLQRSEQRKTSTATRVTFRKTYMKSFSYRFSCIQCINIQEYQTRLIAFFKLWRLVFISIWAITEKNIIPISWEINCINFSHKPLAQGERWNEHSCHILTPTLSQSNVHFLLFLSNETVQRVQILSFMGGNDLTISNIISWYHDCSVADLKTRHAWRQQPWYRMSHDITYRYYDLISCQFDASSPSCLPYKHRLFPLANITWGFR